MYTFRNAISTSKSRLMQSGFKTNTTHSLSFLEILISSALFVFLKKRGKKVVLFKGGFIASDLRKAVDKVVNAQNIKKYIAEVVKRQKPGVKPGLANR